MRYVICYDIADDRRREHVTGVLLDYAARIQESVFTAELDVVLNERMQQRLKAVLDAKEDKLHEFALCGRCEERIWTIGDGKIEKDADFYVI